MKNDTNNQPGSVGMGLRFCSALLAALSFCTSFGSVAVMAEEAAPATPETAADTDSTGLNATLQMGEDGSISGTLQDGASISVDADGNAVLDMSGIARAAADQQLENGVPYKDSATGATVYRLEDFVNEEAPDIEYEDDTDAFMAWMDAPTITTDELSDALEKASAYDEAVLQNCYEPVVEIPAVQAAAVPIQLDGETTPETAETGKTAPLAAEPVVTYRLKDEYAAPVQTDGSIAFSEDNGVAALDANGSTTQSATIVVVNSNAVYLRIVDEKGKGITGASVTYSFDGVNAITYDTTKTLVSDNGETGAEGLLKLNTGDMKADTASLFLNVSAPGYYGITRVADIVDVGSVVTYTLCKQSNNASGVYLRGSYIDGVDTKDGYTLMLTAANTNAYDITAIVGVAGDSGVDTLPTTATMSTVNTINPGYGTKTFNGNRTQMGGDYAVYTFTDKWSHYEDVIANATLRKGDTLQLDKLGENEWITLTKEANGSLTETTSDSVSMGISTELPDLERLGYASNISFGLCGGDGAAVSLPDDFLGGSSKISSDLLSIPVFFYVSLQGSLLIGFGPVLDLAETKWLQQKQNNPQSQNPSQQQKTEKLVARIKTQTMEAFNVKEKYSEKQNKRKELYNKLKDNKKNDKKILQTAGGSIDWAGSVFLFGRIDTRSYRTTVDFGISMQWNGTLQYTAYVLVGPVPFYLGVELSGSGGGSAVIGAQTKAILDLSQYELSNDTNLTLNGMIMLEAVLGAGLRGIAGLEGFANASVDGAVKLLYSQERTTQSPIRFQVNASVTAGLRARLFFLTYTKSWRIIDKLLYDSWGIYNSGTPDAPSTAALMTGRPVVIGSEDTLPAYSALLADPEVRAAAADAANQEYGIYTETLDGIAPEVSIAEDGTQEDLRADEPVLLANDTAGQSPVTGVTTMEKSQVMTGSDFQYVTAGTKTYLFRIATVDDDKLGKVARVVYSEGDADGQSSKVFALPATDGWGVRYGYDTNFAVVPSEYADDIAYIAIVSAPSADTSDIVKQAKESRIRVLTIYLPRGQVLHNTLVEKAPLADGRTDYAYTGTPAVYGRMNFGFDTAELPYLVACAVTTDVEAMANGTLTNSSDALAVATNLKRVGNYGTLEGVRRIYASTVVQDGIRRTGLTFVNTKTSNADGGWGLVSVDLDQPETMDILDISYSGEQLSVVPSKRFSVLSGTISNLQHLNQSYNSEVYFTCDGDLYTLEHNDNQYTGFKKLTDKTDVGDDVVLPSGDGLTLVSKTGTSTDNLLAVFSTTRGRDVTGSDGKMQTVTDMVVRVYTLMSDGNGGYTVSGPRESVVENRNPVKTAVVAVGRSKTSENLLRLMYLANQSLVQTSQPSGSIADGSYQVGTAQDTSDLYMWELRPGWAAELTSFVATTPTIYRTRSQTVNFDINIDNVGGYSIHNVTIEVHKGSPTGELVGSYVVPTSEAGANGFASLGPGSNMNTTLSIPLGQDWDGAVTLYAAIVRADGQALSSEYTPVWVGTNDLIDEGHVTMAVSQTTNGYDVTQTLRDKTYNFRSTTATVRIAYENSINPRNLKLHMEVLRFDASGKEDWYDTQSDISLAGTPTQQGSTNNTVNLMLDLTPYWQAGNTAVRFTVRGDENVTLNCLYTTGQVLLSPGLAQEWGVDSGSSLDPDAFRVVVRNQDSYYGTVDSDSDVVLKADNQPALQTAANDAGNAVDNTALLTATPREGYEVDHWEYLVGNDADGKNVWETLTSPDPSDPENKNKCLVSFADFIGRSTARALADGTSRDVCVSNTIIVRAVYTSDSRAQISKVRIMTDIESTDGQDASGASVMVQNADGTSLAATSTAGGLACDAAKGSTLTLSVTDYDPLDWAPDGWYAYTVDEFGNQTLGAKLSDAEVYTLTANENLYIMAKLKQRTEPLVYLDGAGGTAVGGAPLGLQRAGADNKLTLPVVTRENCVFYGWASSVNGFYDGNMTIEVQDGEVLTALWGYKHPSVYTWAEEGGTTSGNVYDVLPGTEVTVTAYPDSGWQFDHWESYEVGDDYQRVEGAGAVYTFTMGNDIVRLRAIFVRIASGEQTTETDTPQSTAQPTAALGKKDDSSAQPTAQPVIPSTADGFPLEVVLLLLVVSACGFGTAVTLSRRRRRK